MSALAGIGRLNLARSSSAQGITTITISDFDIHLTWFGRGNRIRSLDFPRTADAECPVLLSDLVETVLRYRDQAGVAP